MIQFAKHLDAEKIKLSDSTVLSFSSSDMIQL